MTSVADVLRPLAPHRLRQLAAKHGDPFDPPTPETVAAAVGVHVLRVVSDLRPSEIVKICEALGLSASGLARLVAPPATRGDCESGLRPCPYQECRYNGFARAWPHPSRVEFCALDVAGEGGMRLVDLARLVGVGRERVRQIEAAALVRARGNARRMGIELESLLGGEGGAAESGQTPATRSAGSRLTLQAAR